MTVYRCACGHEAAGAAELMDHLGEMFGAADDVGLDGVVHAEAVPSKCLCGLACSDAEELDAHLLAVFTPANTVGRDGVRHGDASV